MNDIASISGIIGDVEKRLPLTQVYEHECRIFTASRLTMVKGRISETVGVNTYDFRQRKSIHLAIDAGVFF